LEFAMPAVLSVSGTVWEPFYNLNISKKILCKIQAFNGIPRALIPLLFKQVQPTEILNVISRVIPGKIATPPIKICISFIMKSNTVPYPVLPATHITPWVLQL
jgi:hypothetical protein